MNDYAAKPMSDSYPWRGGIAWQDLHPIGRLQFKDLSARLEDDYRKKRVKFWFRPHMGYRSPEVQDELFLQRPVVTKAKGWQSAHQYGLAVDFVPWVITSVGTDDEGIADPNTVKGAWMWTDEADWPHLKKTAERYGLRVPITWDRPHVEHPAWDVLKDRLRGG